MIIAGKAHPHDTQGKEVIQSIIYKVREYGLERHVVFLEDYDTVISRYMVKGCDIWLNTPIKPMEASGTSGMKAALNGTLNLSILDGWFDEAFDGTNGFAIGHGEEYANTDEQNIIEASSLYDLLEQVIVPMFYDRSNLGRVPDKWVTYMKSCIKSIAWNFSTTRMVKEYATRYYLPAIKNYKILTTENAKNASMLYQWKNSIRSNWGEVEIIDVSTEQDSEFFVGKSIHVSARVHLGNLTTEDVVVQVFYGTVNHEGELIDTGFKDLNLTKSEEHLHHYEGEYICNGTGNQGFTIRVLPTHKLLVNSADMHLCAWAQ
ncbi:MAG: alpha-glucan family phosphorylase [Ignavibacteriae bacterium]|nr:alpha-glucan family phosphorylase [Ignavibacteriota bacterium]